MKKSLSLLSLSLAIIMTTTSLIACQQPEKNGSVSSKTSNVASEVKSNFNETGLPIVNEPVEFTLMTPTHPMDTKKMEDKKIFQQLEKDTNVKIKWESVPSEGWTEKINLIIASGNLPDGTFGGEVNLADAIPAGKIMALDDYLKFTPNLKKSLETTKVIALKSKYMGDGKIYQILGAEPVFSAEIELPMFINKIWLKNVNMEVPTTTDEFYEVLKAFKAQDANGNGDKNDEIPFAVGDMWGEQTLTWLYGAWGMMSSKNPAGTTIIDGKLSFNATNPKFQEALNYFHKLFSEGLINDEFLTQPQNVRHSQNMVNPPVYGSFIEWNSSMLTLPEVMEQYEVILPLKGPHGDQKYTQGTRVLNLSSALTIFTGCKQPEVLMRWIDYINTPEIGHEMHLGPKGEYWDINPETNKFKQNADKLKELQASGSGIEHYRASEVMFTAIANRDPAFTGNNLDYAGTANEAKANWSAMYKPYIFPEAWFPATPIMEITEEEKEIGLIWPDLAAYVQSFVAQSVTKGVTDKQFEKHIQQCKDLQYEKIIAFHQSRYEELKELID